MSNVPSTHRGAMAGGAHVRRVFGSSGFRNPVRELLTHSPRWILKTLALSSVGLLLLVACDAAPGAIGPAAPPGPLFSMGNGVTAIATGGGRYEPTAMPGSVWTVSFAALQRDPSTLAATGRWQYRIENWQAQGGAGSVDLRGNITCLATDPATGRAWLGGVLTHNGSTHPRYNTEPGAGAWFRVVDDGEGSGASQNGRLSIIFGEHIDPLSIGTAQHWCEERFWHEAAGFMGPIRGNIQVR
jgi:hypothetical protein